MKIGRTLTAILLGLLVLAVFVGCAKKPETLKVLYYIDATAPGYAEDVAVWDKFVKDNPDIKLEKEELFNEPYHQKVQAYIAAGEFPDVIYMWPSGRSALVHEKKLVKDLGQLLGSAYLQDFNAAAINPAQQSGNYLAILPQSFTYTTVMYANTKLLADNGLAVPKTYEELKAMVPVLKAKGIQTVLMANKDTWVMQSCLFSTVAGRMAGDEFFDQVKTGAAKLTDKPFVDALAFIDTMYKDGVLSRDTVQLGYGEGPGVFAAGKAAFYIDGDWRQGAFITDKASGKALIDPAAQNSDFAMIAFPAIPGEKNPGEVSAIAGVGYGISSAIPAGSKKEEAAVRLVKYLYSPEVQQIRLELGAFIPTRKGVTSDKIEPFTKKVADYYQANTNTCYVLDGVLDPSVYTPINDGLQQMGLGTTTPAKVAEEAQKAMDAFLKK